MTETNRQRPVYNRNERRVTKKELEEKVQTVTIDAKGNKGKRKTFHTSSSFLGEMGNSTPLLGERGGGWQSAKEEGGLKTLKHCYTARGDFETNRSKKLLTLQLLQPFLDFPTEFSFFSLLAHSGREKGRLHCVRFRRENADESVFPSVIARISTVQM
jgi:hypothetical protein